MTKKKTTADFIKQAIKIHGDKYDYSKVQYVNGQTKICIICPKHGEFVQTPRAHIYNKQGCRRCGNDDKRKKLSKSLNDFTEQAKNVHGDKYNYTLVEYKNNKSPITIICPKHGEFTQTPDSHLRGLGCAKCGLDKRTGTTETFIEQAREIHGDTYDYSLVEYKNTRTPVTIICSEHGEFKQVPYIHLAGYGCILCGNKNRHRTSFAQFVERGKEIHQDKYDYSVSKPHFVSLTDKKSIPIKCPIHGIFYQRPDSHLHHRAGCPECGVERKRNTTKDFIEQARKVHGDKYNYSKVEYINWKSKVIIICPLHGEFTQTAHFHITNQYGCPKCSTILSKIESNVRQVVPENSEFNNTTLLNGKELDIVIGQFAIEVNGDYWHSVKFKSYDYHALKSDWCNVQQIKLLHIFEHKWKADQPKYEKLIEYALGRITVEHLWPYVWDDYNVTDDYIIVNRDTYMGELECIGYYVHSVLPPKKMNYKQYVMYNSGYLLLCPKEKQPKNL